MKAPLSVIAAVLLASSAFAADDAKQTGSPTPGKEAGNETSDRTPGKETSTPLPQTTKTDGETSDRTPENHDQTKK